MNRVPSLRSITATGNYVCPSCRQNLLRGAPSQIRYYRHSSVAQQSFTDQKPRDFAEPLLAINHGTDIKSALKSHGQNRRNNRESSPSEKGKRRGRRPDDAAARKSAEPVVQEEKSLDVSHETDPQAQTSVLSAALEAARVASVNARERIQALLSGRSTTGTQETPDITSSPIVETLATMSGDPSATVSQQNDSTQSEIPESRKVEGKRKSSKQKGKSKRAIKIDSILGQIRGRDIDLDPLETDLSEVPRLSYGLERVLFNPGFYFLQDPRSRVFNFDPYLEKLMPVSDFDFGALKQFTPSSKDSTLMRLTSTHGKRYCGSTSSMTGLLSHFHYLISKWRPINTEMLSAKFPVSSRNFTQIQRGPATALLRLHKETGVYAIDSDKTFSTSNILSMLGISMEKLLTLDTADYEKYRLSNKEPVSQEQRERSDSYHFSKVGDFMFRSQLDARDPRLPGTGVFDLKTRAVIPIRMAVGDFEKLKGYEILGTNGEYESFEREYHDMIRSAFLKYSLQVRMGRMDGIFVAYHNTERIFGFQYIPLGDMDLAVHGQSDTALGDQEFKVSLKLLNKLLNQATEKYPNTSLRVTCEMRVNKMYFFAEPVSEAELEAMDAAAEEKAQKYMRSMNGRSLHAESNQKTDESFAADESAIAEEERAVEQTLAEEAELESAETSSVETDDNQEGQVTLSAADDETASIPLEREGLDYAVEEAAQQKPKPEMVDESVSVTSSTSSTATETVGADDAIAEILSTNEDENIADLNKETAEAIGPGGSSVARPKDDFGNSNNFAVSVRIVNNQNGSEVERPRSFAGKQSWEVSYEIEEIKDPVQSENTYNACKRRRELLLGVTGKRTEYNMSFLQHLTRLSHKGKAYRRKMTEKEAGKDKVVLSR